MSAEVLMVVEDERLFREELARHFRQEGWQVVVAEDLAEARRQLDVESVEPLVVLSDLSLPDGSGLDLLEERRSAGDSAEWLFLTGYGTVPDSVRAMTLGAFDFLEKPVPLERLELVVQGAARASRAHRMLREQQSRAYQKYSLDAFVGSSKSAREAVQLIRKLSGIPFNTLLLEGETGTGKGLVARILHHTGLRAAGPLVEVNCAALPSELLESELFGHEPGSFTGARGRHRGFFEQANSGTLFLDEIGEMPLGLQAKLLKAVEDRRIRRLGGEREIEVDIQLVTASNRDLEQLAREGSFREDLYHRLSVLRMELAPLRERTEDIPDLVWAAIAEFNARGATDVKVVPEQVWDRLLEYRWPGNVRELRNVIERSVLLSVGTTLSERWLHLPSSVGEVPGADDPTALVISLDGKMTLDEIEARIISTALERTGRNVSAAARLLGISRQTLRYRIEKHGLSGEG